MDFLQTFSNWKHWSHIHRLVSILYHLWVLRIKWSSKPSWDKLRSLWSYVNGLRKLIWVTHLLKLLRLIIIHYICLTKFMIWFDICFIDRIICVILKFILYLGIGLWGIMRALKIIIFRSTVIKILTLFNVTVALFLITSAISTAVSMMSTLKSSNSSIFYLCVTRSNFAACWTVDVY